MSDSDLDLNITIKTFTAAFEQVLVNLKALTESINKLLSACEDDTGTNAVADALATLNNTVHEIPGELRKDHEALANRVAARVLSDMPC